MALRSPAGVYDLTPALLEDVTQHGAVGDGVVDDTTAIKKAMAAAMGLPDLSGGDSGYTFNRRHKVVYFPTGVYRTTSTIPITYMGLAFLGEAGCMANALGALILPDFNGPAFEIDGTTYVSAGRVSFEKLAISKKGTSYQFQGGGISVKGPNWLIGMVLKHCTIMYCYAGLDFTSYSNVGFFGLQVLGSLINSNRYAIYGDTHLDGCRLESSIFSQNSFGGIHAGFTSANISQVNLEGQPDAFVNRGTNSMNNEISMLRFEQNSGDFLLDLGGMDNATVGRMWEGAGQTTAKSIKVIGKNVETSGLPFTPVGGIDLVAYSPIHIGGTEKLGWANRTPVGQQPWASLDDPPDSYTDASWTETADFGGFSLDAYRIGTVGSPTDRANELITSMTWDAGDHILFQFAVRYLNTLGNLTFVVDQAYVGATPYVLAESLNFEHGAILGEVLVFTFLLKNISALDYDKALISIYPYGVGNTGSDALLSPIIYKQVTSADTVTLASAMPTIVP